jgi:PIN domain nuclease of toxin-antitoxin system
VSPKYKRHIRCWDANCVLGWLANEPDKVAELRPIFNAAEEPDSNVHIITSALAFVEVLWLKPHPRLTAEKEQLIRDFFKHSWLSIIDLDTRTAEYARQLIWGYNVSPKDAVYVATAVLRKADCLDTFDGDLIKLSGKIGMPPLTIARPHMAEQIKLPLPPESKGEAEEESQDDDETPDV